MSQLADGDASTLPLDDAQQLDALCDRFESAWKQDTSARPQIDDFVPLVEPRLRPAAVLELLPIELAYLRRRSIPLSLTDYCSRYPAAASHLTRWFQADEARPISPTRLLSPGDHFDKYTILSFLGAGGMGEVYRAIDTTLGREVAIKILLGRYRWNSEAAARIAVEAKALAALKHPHIVTVYEFDQHDDVAFIVLELLEGETLAQRLKRGALQPDELGRFASQLASALAMAHGRNIVHRDLKPQNIFLTTGGDAKVLDFGLARLLESPVKTISEGTSATSGCTTAYGARMGTTGYMSPEQIRGDAIDARSDVFSLGCVLSEMTYGKPPFSRATAAETDRAIQEEAYARPAAPRSKLEASLHRIVNRCVQKSPDERYASGVEVERELKRAQELYTSRGNRRSKIVERASLLALLFLLLLAGGWLWRERQSDSRQIQRLLATIVTDLKLNQLDLDELKQIMRQLVLLERELGIDLNIDETMLHGDVDQPQLEWVKGYLNLERGSEADIEQAMKCFARAKELRHDFAPAFVGLAECQYRLSNAYKQPREAMPQMKAFAEDARRLDEGAAAPLVLLALYEHRYEWDWPAAKLDFESALETLQQQQRDSALARAMYGNSLVLQGEFAAGIAELTRALQLDPNSPQLPVDLALAHLYQGGTDDVEQAETILRELLTQNPNNFPARWALGEVFLQQGDYLSAISELSKAKELDGSPELRAELAYCLGKCKQRADARKLIAELDQESAKSHVPSTARAVARLGLDGEDKYVDEAIALLHQGIGERDEWLVWLEVDAVFQGLKNGRPHDFARLRQKMDGARIQP